jgi:hypothetical protein
LYISSETLPTSISFAPRLLEDLREALLLVGDREDHVDAIAGLHEVADAGRLVHLDRDGAKALLERADDVRVGGRHPLAEVGRSDDRSGGDRPANDEALDLLGVAVGARRERVGAGDLLRRQVVRDERLTELHVVLDGHDAEVATARLGLS